MNRFEPMAIATAATTPSILRRVKHVGLKVIGLSGAHETHPGIGSG